MTRPLELTYPPPTDAAPSRRAVTHSPHTCGGGSRRGPTPPALRPGGKSRIKAACAARRLSEYELQGGSASCRAAARVAGTISELQDGCWKQRRQDLCLACPSCGHLKYSALGAERLDHPVLVDGLLDVDDARQVPPLAQLPLKRLRGRRLPVHTRRPTRRCRVLCGGGVLELLLRHHLPRARSVCELLAAERLCVTNLHGVYLPRRYFFHLNGR